MKINWFKTKFHLKIHLKKNRNKKILLFNQTICLNLNHFKNKLMQDSLQEKNLMRLAFKVFNHPSLRKSLKLNKNLKTNSKSSRLILNQMMMRFYTKRWRKKPKLLKKSKYLFQSNPQNQKMKFHQQKLSSLKKKLKSCQAKLTRWQTILTN